MCCRLFLLLNFPSERLQFVPKAKPTGRVREKELLRLTVLKFEPYANTALGIECNVNYQLMCTKLLKFHNPTVFSCHPLFRSAQFVCCRTEFDWLLCNSWRELWNRHLVEQLLTHIISRLFVIFKNPFKRQSSKK